MVTLLHYTALPHQDDIITVHQVLQLVRDEDDGLVAKLLPDAVMEDVIGHVGVEGAERVVQDVNVPVTVEGTGQADSLALPAAQVGATFTNLCEVSVGQQGKVWSETAGAQHRLIPVLLVLLSKQDVVSQCCVQDPGLLSHVGQPSSDSHAALQHNHLS